MEGELVGKGKKWAENLQKKECVGEDFTAEWEAKWGFRERIHVERESGQEEAKKWGWKGKDNRGLAVRGDTVKPLSTGTLCWFSGGLPLFSSCDTECYTSKGGIMIWEA